VCAQEARWQLDLDRVLLVPVGEAPHRNLEADAGAEARVALCEAAVAGDDRLEVSRAEVDRPGLSYTAQTLELMSAPHHDLTLIVGADQACALPQWHEPSEVLARARVAVASREGVAREAVRARLEGLRAADGAPASERLDFFDMPRIDVSSSLVRSRVASGRPIRYLVGERVASEIDKRALYRAAAGVSAR